MKNSWKKALVCILIIAAAALFTACTEKQPASKAADAEPEVKTVSDIKITAILIDSASEVTTAFGEKMKAYAEDQGADFTLLYHDRDIANEQAMIENAISAGVDVLILDPETDTECADVMTQATQSGIVTIIYNMEPKAEYTYRFSGPHYQMGWDIGVAAAEWANENLVAKGEPVKAIVGNVAISPNAVDRRDGIIDAVEKFCPEMELLAEYEMAYKEAGLIAGENIQQAQPDANLMLCINDNSATGVYEAFLAAGRGDENVGIFGIDGTAEGLYDISQGGIYIATRKSDHTGIAAMMVQAGIDKVLGNPGAPTEQQIFWETTLVDISNVNEYKEDWGHLVN